LTELVGAEMRLGMRDRERLRWAAFLHDIGKLSVPAQVLNKPGRLDRRLECRLG
jgi:HD-GYP domain-containing protein (c-di-GMP phosphodiesterase class II)